MTEFNYSLNCKFLWNMNIWLYYFLMFAQNLITAKFLTGKGTSTLYNLWELHVVKPNCILVLEIDAIWSYRLSAFFNITMEPKRFLILAFMFPWKQVRQLPRGEQWKGRTKRRKIKKSIKTILLDLEMQIHVQWNKNLSVSTSTAKVKLGTQDTGRTYFSQVT